MGDHAGIHGCCSQFFFFLFFIFQKQVYTTEWVIFQFFNPNVAFNWLEQPLLDCKKSIRKCLIDYKGSLLHYIACILFYWFNESHFRGRHIGWIIWFYWFYWSHFRAGTLAGLFDFIDLIEVTLGPEHCKFTLQCIVTEFVTGLQNFLTPLIEVVESPYLIRENWIISIWPQKSAYLIAMHCNGICYWITKFPYFINKSCRESLLD